jgi:hypothetical protein
MQMKYRGHKIHAMRKQILFFLATAIAACGTASASTLFVSATGQFSGSDVGDFPLVTPNGVFSLRFAVDSNPAPLAGSVSSLGFDVPVKDFSYSLNNATVNVAPNEITFYTLADGGLFSVAIGSGLSGLDFLFEGGQVFTGTTASPVFAPGNFAITQWTFSDPSNFDSQTPLAALASVTPTPEPSSVFFLTGGLVVLIRELRKRQQNMKGDRK